MKNISLKKRVKENTSHAHLPSVFSMHPFVIDPYDGDVNILQYGYSESLISDVEFGVGGVM